MSDAVHGDVTGSSLAELVLEATRLTKQFFGHECVSVELSAGIVETEVEDSLLDGTVANRFVTFTSSFVGRVSHAFDTVRPDSGVFQCSVCSIVKIIQGR
jgi:hypothetical protein